MTSSLGHEVYLMFLDVMFPARIKEYGQDCGIGLGLGSNMITIRVSVVKMSW